MYSMLFFRSYFFKGSETDLNKLVQKQLALNSTRVTLESFQPYCRLVNMAFCAFYEPPICNHDDSMHVSFITVYIIIFFHTNSRHLTNLLALFSLLLNSYKFFLPSSRIIFLWWTRSFEIITCTYHWNFHTSKGWYR